MKIAIITFSDFNTNYGSMLQAFSLKSFLENEGHIVEFIKYREFNNIYLKLSLKDKIFLKSKNGLINIYKFFKRKDINKTYQNFEEFKKKFFVYTDLYTSNEELKKNLPIYDCYICGSDQIWNLNCLGGLRKPYFLDFAPKNKLKISYAASLGDYKITNEYQSQISKMINNIDYVSIREKENIADIEMLSKKNIYGVIDPVFLNSKDFWEEFASEDILKGNYAVCYFVRRSKFGKKIINILHEKYNIPIINLSDNMIYIYGTEKKYISSGPQEFLSLIKNAEYTIGTSFHLAAFSIIFEKPFLIVGMESNRNRINNILSLVNLEDNFITEESDYVESINKLFHQKANYNNLNQKINQSKDFLLKSLNKTLEKKEKMI